MQMTTKEKEALVNFICVQAKAFEEILNSGKVTTSSDYDELEGESEVFNSYLDNQLGLCRYFGVDEQILADIDSEVWLRFL